MAHGISPDVFAAMFFGGQIPGQDDDNDGDEDDEDIRMAAASESGDDDDGWVTDEGGDAGDEAPDDS